jgi:hypothetical protein
MATGATGQLGLALPVQGELSGTWGDTVNNGITQYTNIAIAGTLTLTGDGAVTLANTTGDASASNITSTLTGAGTVTAQFAIVRVTGTLTTAKVVTAPSYSKTYTVVNAATGGIVTFKASGQTGVSVAVGETAFVYYNGTDYVKVVGTATAGAAGGSNTQVQFNSSGVLAGSSAFTFVSGTTVTMANDASISGLTVGKGAGAVSTNTAVGASALTGSGGENTAVGSNALAANTTGSQNAAFGRLALQQSTTTQDSVAVGYAALQSSSTGSFNVGVGTQALNANTTASDNTAVGYQSLYSNTTGFYNVAMGGRNSVNNTPLGLNTTGSYNIAYGNGALGKNTTASFNSAVGYEALFSNTTGAYNTALGMQSLNANTTASYNTANGYRSLYTNTTGSQNTAYGVWSMYLTTTGSNNTAVGMYAMNANTTGANNTVVGLSALESNTTASNNTAVGYQAGYSTTTGFKNTTLGSSAGFSISTGTQNTCLGEFSGQSMTTGSNNTFVGQGAGYLITTGAKNVILGSYYGNQDSLDIRTADNYVVLSDGDGNRQITMKEGQTLALDSAVPNAGTGITFPATQSASSNANTLDDYEEGTWTPEMSFGNDTTGITYSTQVGTYEKIGRQVTVRCMVTLTNNGSGSGIAKLSGFPFTLLAASNAAAAFSIFADVTLSGTYYASAVPQASSTFAYFRMSDAYMTETQFTNTANFTFMTSYNV